MSKGNVSQQRHDDHQTTIEIDNPIIGKLEVSTGAPWIAYSGVGLILLLVGFWIYSKYWHAPLMKKVKRRKR